MPRAWSDLYWLALGLAAAVLVVILAKILFCPPRPREGRWAAIVAGLALVAAGCADRPSGPPLPPLGAVHGAGWEDGAGKFAEDGRRPT